VAAWALWLFRGELRRWARMRWPACAVVAAAGGLVGADR
jgi:hypothetical protein